MYGSDEPGAIGRSSRSNAGEIVCAISATSGGKRGYRASAAAHKAEGAATDAPLKAGHVYLGSLRSNWR